MSGENSLRMGPDERGRFGHFGGRFVAETLMPLILELDEAYKTAKADPAFKEEFDYLMELFRDTFDQYIDDPRIDELGIKINVIGETKAAIPVV